MTDHDGMTIRGKWIRHTTLQRDWICGECGGRLVMRSYPNDAERRIDWRTVCYNDASHDPETFIHGNYAARLKAEAAMDRAEARDIFLHLPQELQESITERGKEHAD